MFCPVQNSYFAIEITIDAMKYFCMLFSNICFDRSYFPISFAVVLIACGKNHCMIKHHEGKLLTENTGSQNNHSSWLFGQSWWDADSPKIVQNAVFSVQNTVYCIHTVYIQYSTVHIQYTYSILYSYMNCLPKFFLISSTEIQVTSYMSLIFTTVKNCHQK